MAWHGMESIRSRHSNQKAEKSRYLHLTLDKSLQMDGEIGYMRIEIAAALFFLSFFLFSLSFSLLSLCYVWFLSCLVTNSQ